MTHPSQVSTPTKLRDMALGVEFRIEPIDSGESCVRAYLSDHHQEIVDLISDSTELWKGAHASLGSGESLVYGHTLNHPGYRVDVELYYYIEGFVRVFATVMTLDWAERRMAEMKHLFPEPPGRRGMLELGISEFLERLDMELMTDFSIAHDIDVSGIRDANGRGLDPRIAELIRMLNKLGLETVSSCSGHRDGRRPNIHFPGDQLERLGSLLTIVRSELRTNYRITVNMPLVTNICMMHPLDLSLSQAQIDFDSLLEFLQTRMGKTPFWSLSSGERLHRVRRGIRGILKAF